MPSDALFTLPNLTAALMLLALIAYAVLGGADYGGGVWDLFASGPRARKQRELIERAIGPVWEANHVWLIFLIVLLFTAFPPAFAALATALNIPLTIMLIGVVLRGCAFTFRHYDRQDDIAHRRWSHLFAVSSLVTPVMLGICIGAISTGEIHVVNGVVVSGFLHPWLGLFPLLVGLFALALFAFLAAVYLTVEAEKETEQGEKGDTAGDVEKEELLSDFRYRALFSGLMVGALAFAVLFLSGSTAPAVRAGLTAHPWSWALHIVTGGCAVGAFWALWARRFHLARLLAVAQVALILLGWSLALFPFLVPTSLTIVGCAAPPATLRMMWGTVLLGTPALLISLAYLFRVFKSRVQE